MADSGIAVERSGAVATVKIDRQERRNALDLGALDALAAAWRSLDADDDVRAVILTGAGDVAFSAGADLKQFAPDGVKPEPAHDAFFPERFLLKPLIAAVNGVCLAGGCELLLACDIRIAAAHATFGLPEPTLGLFPAGGSAVRGPRRLGWAAAMELLLTGATIDAGRALSIGLVSRVVDNGDLAAATTEVAEAAAACSPAAVRAIKQCALETDGTPLLDAFEKSTIFSKRVHDGPDAAEGIAAFREKRPPAFRMPS